MDSGPFKHSAFNSYTTFGSDLFVPIFLAILENMVAMVFVVVPIIIAQSI